jgi:excisionase family DNA binding protein
MGIGNVINQSLQGMTGRPSAPAGPTPPAASTASPDIMTPAEAATVLRVSEEDVLAAITSGDLKARKIGSAYRISKDALDAFLKGQ